MRYINLCYLLTCLPAHAGMARLRAGFDDVAHRLRLTTGAQISVCKALSLSTGSTMPSTGTETVPERPLLSWEGETRLPDFGTLTTGADFQDYLH